MVVVHAVDPWRGIGRWVDTVADLHGRIAHRFARSEVRERARRYWSYPARADGSWLG